MIYLPIAGIALPFWLLFSMGAGVGLLSGLFGVGGGFLLTPLLMFFGVPSTVAVATGANQVVGSSVAGLIAHWRRGNVDFRMGFLLVAGGAIGSVIGIAVFDWLRKVGQIDLVISLCYVVFLGTVGLGMGVESLLNLLRRGKSLFPRKLHRHIGANLPWKMRFPRSRLYISALLPVLIGLGGGVLAALMGVGGGFILVPAMIYVLEMPTVVAVATSLFQILFVTAAVTEMQAIMTQTVDVVLMLILLLGGVIGAQIGVRLSDKLGGAHLRGLLALMVLAVCGKLLFDLMVTPVEVFSTVAPPS